VEIETARTKKVNERVMKGVGECQRRTGQRSESIFPPFKWCVRCLMSGCFLVAVLGTLPNY